MQLTSIRIVSAGAIFTGAPAEQLEGTFDGDKDGTIFKAVFGGSFGAISFGTVAPSELEPGFLLEDLRVGGSLAGGGGLGNVDLLYRDSLLFADGFESGYASYWSGTSGPAGDGCFAPIPIAEGVVLGDLSDNTGGVSGDSSCGTEDTIDEWYLYSASCDGVAQASTCGSGFDTVLSAFLSCDSEDEVACNDDSCGVHSILEFPVGIGEPLLIRVSGYRNATGSYRLELICSEVR